MRYRTPSGVEPRGDTVLVKADSFLKEVVGAIRKLVSMVGHQFEVLVIQSRSSRKKFTEVIHERA